jgi:hypothetical protein
MNIDIGDKVRFLNDTGGGMVVKILPKNIALIKTKDDFEYTVPLKELVLISKSTNQTEEKSVNTQKPQKKEKEQTKPELKDDENIEIYLAFVNSEDNPESFECYLLNDSNHYLFVHAVIKGLGGATKKLSEKTEPNTMVEIGNITRELINTSESIVLQIIMYGHKHDVLKNMIQREVKIEAVKFYNPGVFKPNDYLDQNAYMFLLYREEPGLSASVKTQEDFIKLLQEKEDDIKNKSQPGKISKPHRKPEIIEVDLHINQLVDNVVGMTNHEILQIQMKMFHETMTEAIQKKAGKIVFIHGIGNGTLKNSIRESISQQYKLHFEDASYKEYGFGATMVLL